MKVIVQDSNIDQSKNGSHCKTIYWLGGLVSMILIAYCISTILIIVFIGAPPKTIEECFSILNNNKLQGLLRLDILTVFIMPLYYLLFYSIYLALKRTNHELVAMSTIFIFAGLTLFLATSSVFSYLNLSNKYALAATDMQKNQLLAAGEAVLASDMWHGTSALVGGLLLQTGGLLISFVMLKSDVFNKITAYTGILIFGLDLAHIVIGLFLPIIGSVIMVVAGTLYLLWFPLIGFHLFKLSKIGSYYYAT
jgi:hypothetical protein